MSHDSTEKGTLYHFISISLSIFAFIVFGYAFPYLWGLALVPLGVPAIGFIQSSFILGTAAALFSWQVISLSVGQSKKAAEYKDIIVPITFIAVLGFNCLTAYILSFWM